MKKKSVISCLLGFGIIFVSIYYLEASPLSRLYINEEVFVLDKTGATLLRKEGQTRRLLSSIKGVEDLDSGMLMELTQTFQSELGDYKPFYIYQKWELLKNKALKVSTKEYDQIKWIPDPRFKDKKSAPKILEGINVIKKEETILKNFEPISWVSAANSDKNVVLRLTPNIEDIKALINLSDFPIASTHITVFDSQDNVWIRDFGAEGKLVGIKIHNHGALLISFSKFKGAEEIGSANGNKIEVITDGQRMITFLSQAPFLPQGINAKVYGIYKKVPSTKEYTSPIIFSGTDPEQFSW